MNVIVSIVAVVFVLAVLASTSVLSAAESAVRTVPRVRARRLAESGGARGAAFEGLSERPSRLMSAHAAVLVFGVGLGTGAVTSDLAVIWQGVPVWTDACVAFLVVFVLVFAFGEALPRAVALSNPEGVGLASARAAGWLARIGYPIARSISTPLVRVVSLVSGERGADVPWLEPGEEHRFGATDEEEASREAEEEDLMEAVSGLHEKIVREIMIPRTDMVAIEDTATLAETLRTITAAGVSRVPVYHETLDDIRGILYAKDLLPRIGAEETGVLPADLARPALFVPETKPVEELLGEMRRRTHIAIVADEYGGTAGLVTIEDLLEEIVGEIYDEYDPLVSLITELPDGRYRVDARLAIDEFDERFGTSPEVEADTVGGLFTELAGHIPVVGESVEVEGVRLTVDDVQGNRVKQLIIELVPTEEAADE